MHIFRVLSFAFAAFLSLNLNPNLILHPHSHSHPLSVSVFVSVSAVEILTIERPASLKKLFPGGNIPDTPALFGMPNYLLEKRGILVYGPRGNRDGCSPIIPNDPVKSPYWNTLFGGGTRADEKTSKPVFLLLDRGGCTFTTKIRNAQSAVNGNLISVVVANDQPTPDSGLPYMQDDGHGKDIQLSSLMISQENAQILQTYLIAQEEAVIAQNAPQPPIFLHVQYSVPNPDGRVEYELWTTSYEEQSALFKSSFGEVARTLADRAVLIPHYFIVDGISWGCASGECGNQCIKGGKYCAADPEKDPTTGYDGQDIVLENVRQLCLWQYIQPSVDVFTNATVIIHDDADVKPFDQPRVWFDYVERLAARCPNAKTWKTEECSYSVLDTLDILVPGLSKKVKACFDNVFNTISTSDTPIIPLLDIEMKKQEESGIFVLPQTFVNKRPYYGTPSCPSPILPASCGLLSMICAGFALDNVPPICHVVPTISNVEQNNSTTSGSSIGAVIGIVIAFGAVAGIAVYVYMKKQNMAMRDDIDSLLKQYLPLEGGGGIGGLSNEPGSKHHSSSNGNGSSSISLSSLSMSNSGVTPGKKRATGQDAHRLIGQGTQDEEDVQL